tara:strand:- start:444 stop:1550 length:1107 start_codon:yes stop_codon:yes gene_type:complete
LSNSLNQIFLNDFHESIGAKFIPFSGYSMPINYSTGIINENLHTRKSVGLFDVSHMGQILINDSFENRNYLKKIIPLDFDNLKINKSSYSFILNEKGCIIDDIIVSKLLIKKSIYFFIVYNSSRKEIDQQIFKKKLSNFQILNNNCLFAVQGPLSESVINNFYVNSKKIKFMEIDNFLYHDEIILISRSGYTGEDGFEISIPNSVSKLFVEDLLSYKEVIPCGLGSRDSLRVEAGLSLYGNELDDSLTPVEAGLKWAISSIRLKEGNFNGYEIIQKHFLEGTNNKRIGIKLRSKSILRSGMNIVNENNVNIGKITSGSYSPNLNISIGIAYVNKKLFERSKNFFCIIRNSDEKLEICDLPFLKHKYKR